MKQKTPWKTKKSFRLGLILGLVLFLAGLGFFFWLLNDLPSPTKLSQAVFPTSTKILDRHGQLLYEIYADQNRTPVELKEIPEYVQQATIAIEDKEFYQHRGLAWKGITRALYKIIFKKELQGGSTITQQLVKTTLLTPERTLKRKLREAVLAWSTELLYSKNQILEMYLNHVPYGGTAYGIEEAAQSYFGKSVKEVSLAEAALLAGLPAAPTKYSPFGANPKLAKTRQRQVLERMAEDGYITSQQADQAYQQELNFEDQKTNIKAPHFVMYVKNILVEKYNQRLVEQGGLRVTTSLDWSIQKFAQQTVASEAAKLVDRRVSNAAALVTKPSTGEILAMVGSRDYFDQKIDGNVNITTSLRQPGSSIKPINYAAGLANGHTPATLFLDVPTCFTSPGQPALYCPHNYDHSFHGPVTLRYALANSYNIPAVKMLALNGLRSFMATAESMGIDSWQAPSRYGLSLTLGGGEVKMTDMAVAFGVFANLGQKVELQPILKVTDYQGKVYEEYQPEVIDKPRVLAKEVAFLISHILSDNKARTAAFGSNSQLVIPNHRVAVKTGTTDHPRGPRDNWTIGYTPSFLIATWVGNNDNSPMNPYLVSGVTGAAPIWNQLTNFILKNTEEEFWPRPDSIVEAATCTWQKVPEPGQDQVLATAECTGQQELFIKGTEKDQSVSWVEKKEIWIDKTTNQPPKENQTDNLELREHLVGHSPLAEEYCLTCPQEDKEPVIVKVDENLQVENPS